MTTRREFIQGVIAGMIALVLPKAAKAMPLDEPVVEPEHGLRVDGRSTHTCLEIAAGFKPLLMIPTCARPASKLYGPGHIDWIHFPECSIGKLADE